ncbi:hypothetical protein H4R34_001177 [Dimargaris verticillata]|uniref:Uncharacterized protein n=1 Tax=Dimargaris verticillata TaxID=2761393 RepID=A0A9W8BAC7_9FUNG|nr:hypothetical protein H4R34_001177 [Dimargaris verticillata]
MDSPVPMPPTTVKEALIAFLVGSERTDDMLSLREFKELFPKVYQSHRDVASLHLTYTQWCKELKKLVAEDIDVQYAETESLCSQAERPVSPLSNEAAPQPTLSANDSQSPTTRDVGIAQAIECLRQADAAMVDSIQRLERGCNEHTEMLQRKIADLETLRYPDAPEDQVPLPWHDIDRLQEWVDSLAKTTRG